MSMPPVNFSIELRRRIWRVTLDGAFYGDYRSKRHAVESAEAAAQGFRAKGRAAHVQRPAEAKETT